MTKKDRKIHVLLISCLCSEEVYTKLIPEDRRTSQQAQKFLRLISTGLTRQDVDVQVLCKIPLPLDLKRGILRKPNNDTIDNVRIKYIPTRNLGYLSNIYCFFYTQLYVMRYCKSGDNYLVINDLLYLTSYLASKTACKIRKLKDISIITDLPQLYFRAEFLKKAPLMRLRKSVLQMPDGYLPISDFMNQAVNSKRRPFAIIEGIAEDEHSYHKVTSTPYFFMYAGGLYPASGIVKFATAFSMASPRGWELHIYGDGIEKQKIIEICKKNDNIKYGGVKQNNKIIENELKATILINPRSTVSDFTKYSFPSKIIEYMTTGTAVLTTKLAGLSDDYLDNVFMIDDESLEGMIKSIEMITFTSIEDITALGEKAREFIIKNKGALPQALKIKNLISDVLCNEYTH